MLKAGGLILFFLCWINPAKAANCEVVKYATELNIVNNRIVRTDTIIIRINNRSGEDYSEVQLDYSHDNPITRLNAWIIDRNGVIVRYLKNKEIKVTNTVSSTFYTDYFTKQFTLKHNEYPYYIAYTSESLEKQYLTAFWSPVIDLDVPTLDATLTLKHPEEFKVNVIQNQIKNPFIITSSGIIVQQWNTIYDGSLRSEIYGPNIHDYLPSVQIIPLQFHYGISGTMSSWQSFGDWQSRLITGLDELPETERKLVQAKIENLKNKKDIVKALYHYLQDHTRYIDVQIGIGGMKPYPASYVSQNKFGDCKALSIYMKALLKFAGIESYYVLVKAGISPGRFYSEVPFQQFNHAIVAVPIENDTIWLENTNNCIPFGYYGSFTQNRHGLLIDGANSKLVKIPPLEPEKVTNGRKFEFKITESGGTTVSANFTFRGSEFEGINSILLNFPRDEQNKIIHELLPFPAFDLYDWKMIKNGRDAQSITLLVSAEINQIVNPISDQYYFSFQPGRIPDIELPAARKLPVLIPYPVVTYDTLNYKLPSGKKFIEIPPDKKLETKFGRYAIKFLENENSLTIYREFVLNRQQVNLDEYPIFYDFISSLKTHEKLKILFQ